MDQFREIPEEYQNFKAEFSKEAVMARIRQMIEEHGMDAMPEVSEIALQFLRVEPKYEQADKSDFDVMRNKLNSEPGLIISNHPGYFDVAAIMKTLRREDIKIFVSGESYEKYAGLLGDKHFIKRPETREELRKAFGEIKSHFGEGGALLFFPTGGGEKDLKHIEFQSGMRAIVSQMEDDQMVYSFNFNPEDSERIRGQISDSPARASSDFVLDQIKDAAGMNMENQTVRVQERYSDAREWKELLDDEVNGPEKNIRLRDHYLEQFEDNDQSN